MAPFSKRIKHALENATRQATPHMGLELLEARQMLSGTDNSDSLNGANGASSLIVQDKPLTMRTLTERADAVQAAIDKFRTHIIKEVHKNFAKQNDSKFQAHIAKEQEHFAAKIAKKGGSYTPIDFSDLLSGVAKPPAATLTGVAASSTQINLTWTSVTGATAYKLEVSANGGNSWSVLVNHLQTSYSQTGLAPGVTRKYRVSAIGAWKTGAPSTAVTVTTLLAAPTGFRATPYSTTRVDLNWTVVSKSTGYKIERSPNQTTWAVVTPATPLTGASVKYSDTTVLAGTTYYYRLSSTSAGGASSVTSTVTVTTLPGTATVTAAAASSTQINLSWPAVTGATSYKIESSVDGGNIWSVRATQAATTYSNSSLTPDSVYKYRVTVINATGAGAASAVVSATTPVNPPASVSVSPFNPTRIDVVWIPVVDATSYKIERSVNQTVWTLLTPATPLTGASNIYSDTTVLGGTTYYFRVSAVSAGGTSTPSTVVHAQTLTAAPTLTATVNSATQVTLSWPLVLSATSYYIERSTDAGITWASLASPTVTTYVNTGLTADSTYQYRVSAINPTGTSAASSIVTAVTPLLAPTSLTATALGTTSIKIAWTPVADASNYKIERSTNQTVWTVITPNPVLNGLSDNYTDATAVAGTTYYYRVSSINAAGTSAPSTSANALTYPGTPTLTAATASATAVNLSWTVALSATSYFLERSTDGGNTWASLASPTATTYANTALTADTTYKYRVSAINATATSPASTVTSATTMLLAPTNVSATSISTTEIDLLWTPVVDATNYKLERSLNQTVWTVITPATPFTGSSSSFADTTAAAGTTYYYRLSAIDTVGTSAASTAASALTYPAAPTLTATVASATAINLSWVAISGATSYKVETSTDGGFTWSTLGSPTTTTYAHGSLTADSVHKYRVSAINATGASVPSTVQTITTLLASPTGLGATAASATEIDLVWNATGDATGFKLERSVNQTAWTTLVPSPALTGANTAYADTSVASGTSYYYRLSAIDAAGTSAASTVASALSYPGAPTLTATSASATAINLSWTAITGVTSYRLETSTDAGNTWSLLAQPTTVTYANTVLTADSTYKYRISAVNATGTSVVSSIASATTFLNAPTGFAATIASATSVNLTWSPVAHATGFKIERSQNQTTWAALAPSPVLAGTATNYTDTALTAGTTYYYRISSISAAGTSVASSTVSILTVPVAPTLTGVLISATQINLSWTAAASATSYTLEDSTDGGTTWLFMASLATTTFQANALTPDTAYKFRVKASNATGAGAASTLVSLTTLLPAPTGFTATPASGSGSEIDLAWTAVTDATSYKIERSVDHTTWTPLVPSPALGATSSTFADMTAVTGTVYFYRISANNVAGTSATVEASSAQTIPPVPTVTATAVSMTQINLSWPVSRGAASYLVESSPDGNTWTSLASPTTTTYANTGLTTDTSYEYRVTAINATGSSNASTVVTISTLLAAPSTPTAVPATGTTNEVDLAWTAVTDATGYKIERSFDQVTWTTLTISPALGGTASTYADTTLAAGTTYYYRLSTLSASGASAVTSVLTTLTYPASPTLTGTPLSSTQVKLSWNAVKSATSYLVESSPDGNTWTSLASPTATTYTNTGLTADTAYEYRVTAINGTGSSVVSSTTTVTTIVATPTTFTVAAATGTTNEIDLAWDAMAGATGYKIERSTNNLVWTTVTPGTPLTGTASTYADATLSAGTQYYYRISAIGASGTSAAATAQNTTTFAAAPTIAATVVSSTQINLSWNAVKSATSYLLESSPDGNTWTSVASPTATTYNATGLTADTAYQYRITAINPAGSSNSTSVSATTIVAAPTGFSITAATGTSNEIDLQWTAVTDATGYRVDRSLDGAIWSALSITPALGATASTFADTTLAAGTTYYYRISAIGASGTSAAATAQHTTTYAAAPTLAATVASSTQVNLSWTSSKSATSYLVESSPDGNTWTSVASPTTTTYSASGLTADTAYQYRVTAINPTGNSVASNVMSVTTIVATPTGFGVAAASGTSNEIDLHWAAVTDATGYKIERSVNQSTWTTLAPSPALQGTDTTYADTTLSAGTTYYYRISAIGASGTSAAAAVQSTLTYAAAPTLTATVASSTQVNLVWTTSKSATSYLVESSPDGNTWTSLASPTTTTYAATGLTADSPYEFRITAINATGSGAPSTVRSVTTIVATPTGFGVVAASGTSNEIDLTWAAVTDATGYKIERSVNQSIWTTLTPSPVLQGTDTTFADTTLSAGTTYYYRISAIGASGTSAAATVAHALTYAAAPTLSAHVVSATSVSLSWNAVASATSYLIESSPDGNTWTSVAAPATTTYSATGLTADTAYQYRVSAINPTGTGVASSVSTLTTFTLAPGGLTPTVASATEVDLTWTAVTDATSYTIERSLNGTLWTTITPGTPLQGTDTTYSDTGLTAGTDYFYRISTVSAAGTSAASTAVTTTTVPGQATVTADVISATEIDLTWTPMQGATSYLVESSPDGNTWTSLASPTTAFYANTGLTADTSYQYRVTAIDGGGSGAASSVLTVSTVTIPPAGLTLTDASDTEVDVAWTAVTDATGYVIERSDDNVAWDTLTPATPFTATSSTFADTTVSANTSYYYRISAVGAAGQSAASSTQSTLTLLAPPAGLTATAVSATQINLTWTHDTDAGLTGYVIEGSADGSTNWTALESVDATATSAPDVRLTTGTTYYYRLRAVSAAGNSLPGAVAHAVTL